MNRTECVALCRFVQALRPAQAFDEFTPRAWFAILEPVSCQDAESAAVAVAGVQEFIGPSSILAEVKRARAKRVDAHVSEPPPEVAEDTAAYLRWLRADRRRAGDGNPAPAVTGVVVDRPRLRELIARSAPKVGAP